MTTFKENFVQILIGTEKVTLCDLSCIKCCTGVSKSINHTYINRGGISELMIVMVVLCI